jgi:ubiquinone/menaquinone biosynthesis C-methylase UbiE
MQGDEREVSGHDVLGYYKGKSVLDHYEEATRRVGMWASEELVFRQSFPDPEASILELGCGTGRICLSLWMLGYENLTGADFSKDMINRAMETQKERSSTVRFAVEDATLLSFADQGFGGVIFGFNGLMQIPGRKNRQRAMREACRVLKKGGRFVFTTHDRAFPKWKKFWSVEKKKWRTGQQVDSLIDFGDRFEETSRGKLFIHVPDTAEIREDLKKAGFVVERDLLRSRLVEETELVKKFSDECLFWVARKPLD